MSRRKKRSRNGKSPISLLNTGLAIYSGAKLGYFDAWESIKGGSPMNAALQIQNAFTMQNILDVETKNIIIKGVRGVVGASPLLRRGRLSVNLN